MTPNEPFKEFARWIRNFVLADALKSVILDRMTASITMPYPPTTELTSTYAAVSYLWLICMNGIRTGDMLWEDQPHGSFSDTLLVSALIDWLLKRVNTPDMGDIPFRMHAYAQSGFCRPIPSQMKRGTCCS